MALTDLSFLHSVLILCYLNGQTLVADTSHAKHLLRWQLTLTNFI